MKIQKRKIHDEFIIVDEQAELQAAEQTHPMDDWGRREVRRKARDIIGKHFAVFVICAMIAFVALSSAAGFTIIGSGIVYVPFRHTGRILWRSADSL